MKDVLLRDGPLEKLSGGGRGLLEPQEFFSSSNSLYEFSLGHSMNIFLGLIGVQEFFFIYFCLTRIFFSTSPAPLISFLMVRPLVYPTALTLSLYLHSFTYRFSSLNLIHMNYSDYTDTIFTLSNDDATILEQRKDNSSGAFIMHLNINSIQNKSEELIRLKTL